MKRRRFTTLAASGALLSPWNSVTPLMYTSRSKTIRPNRLSKGDTIGLVSPGSPTTPENIEKAISQIESLGFRVKQGSYIREKYGYVSGKDHQRIADLQNMYADEEVRAIWCTRGGYGCTRIINFLDYGLIAQHPKVLIGYSDITALHLAILKETSIIGFHSLVGSSDFSTYSSDYLLKCLTEDTSGLQLQNQTQPHKHQQPVEVITHGTAEGILVGGNLSLLASLSGTPHALDATDKIVFIEDVGEKPYRIDRMLTQLLHSSNLAKARGIVIGTMAGCDANEDDQSLSLMECLVDRLEKLKIPTIVGMTFGHIAHQFVLPVGIKAKMDTASETITLLESALA